MVGHGSVTCGGQGSVTCGGTWECYLWWDMGV